MVKKAIIIPTIIRETSFLESKPVPNPMDTPSKEKLKIPIIDPSVENPAIPISKKWKQNTKLNPRIRSIIPPIPRPDLEELEDILPISYILFRSFIFF
ncbi:hypothetical protein AKJ49_01950 [candidate division MSBL1 archaeon SCGC-AAA382A03]|uniref:Uncharacterized protein n=1 Tax=candidate division MSBL1 archaeon SCGC-AAA382A03 TaxID=1698278 RepID=A0A133VDS2_9EURY|nr:hypothetical protein AKJ49_01950 [candidate division MSBL1 archaeon SCGC-AAA382A03]